MDIFEWEFFNAQNFRINFIVNVAVRRFRINFITIEVVI